MTEQPAVNNMASTLPLADIHLPQAPGYWPLAWGWWVCGIIALCLLVSGLFVLLRTIRNNRAKQRARREALRRLKTYTDPGTLNAINLLLRQTAMSYYSRQQVASLTGEQWLIFLDRHLTDDQQGFSKLSEPWSQGLFSGQALEPQDFQRCYRQAELWLKNAQLPSPRLQQPNVTEGAHV
ncbi:DUF4381 domain-containing protein [Photobacterium atrarenae]|uniref:DUF4381 domain-containing protein n=1 Tax=Photobacterium atrarenae TaxID=865757 RepID=A0ABY5GM03_9GAMM|nr:DUF4381 domain-containing protein [Photobacterium atrarenae]UTV30352.1 DUF4381 domain-containing protein [Photobacterium atrarenae]